MLAADCHCSGCTVEAARAMTLEERRRRHGHIVRDLVAAAMRADLDAVLDHAEDLRALSRVAVRRG
jgi:hypothetical protein